MIQTGLVSVTFRNKTIDEIIALAAKCGLESIEVGSDVHAPRDNIAECRRIAALAKENGISIASYGSYYKLGNGEDFSEYIEAAKVLKAKNIRIWAGTSGSGAVDEKTRKALTEEAYRCADATKAAGLTMSFEYHGGTLTDTSESALRLMAELSHPNAYLYWQPNQNKDTDFNVEALKAVLPYVLNVHVFAWTVKDGKTIRNPLFEHEDAWKKYINILRGDGRAHNLLLEFVKDDADEAFIVDSATLKNWGNF